MADRDSNGKFVKGHKASVGNRGGGRPRRVTEERYLGALIGVISIADWKAICEKLRDKAKEGDLTAIKLVAEYAIGKPVQFIRADVDTKVSVDRVFQEALEKVYGDGE